MYARNLTLEDCSAMDLKYLQVKSVFNSTHQPQPSGCMATSSPSDDDDDETMSTFMYVGAALFVVPLFCGAAMALRQCRKKGGEKEPARETELGGSSGGSSPVV